MAQNISMAQIPPEGVLKLYGGVEIGGVRQKIFTSKAEQRAYFDAHLVMSFNDMSYIRMGAGIQIETDTITISNCNYLSFINKTSGVETEIYAQISPNWEYVNPNTVRIGYAIDWWQTCMHSNITMREGVIKREHMSETDWTAAVANPYADIFQLQTSEDLPMDQSMERIQDASTDDISLYPSIPIHDGVEQVTVDDMRLVLLLGQSDFSKMEPYEAPNGDTYSMESLIVQVWDNGGEVRRTRLTQGIPNPGTVFIMTYSQNNYVVFQRILSILELNGMTGNIIGLYWIPRNYIVNIDNKFQRISVNSKPSNYTPRNPKLYRAPYCYLRVSDETGQSKHYQWEEFKPLINGGVTAAFDLFYSQVGMPIALIAPREYKTILASSVTSDESLFANFNEAIVHENVEQVPYSTDGYLSALGSKYRDTYSSINPLKMITAAAKEGDKPPSFAPTGARQFAEQNAARKGDRLIDKIGNTIGNKINKAIEDYTGVSPSSVIDSASQFVDNYVQGISPHFKKSVVADNYYEGGKGWAGYMRAPLRFIFEKVCPRADIVEQYDKYFDYFGYSSGRIGVPYVYNYIKGTGDQPHFATLDNGDQVTYCQADISVFTNGKAPDIAARAIEAMFSGGVIFTK